MLNTYFTAEVPNDSHWARFSLAPLTFHKNWMHQMKIYLFIYLFNKIAQAVKNSV